VFGFSGQQVRRDYQNAIESYYISIVIVSFVLAAVFVALAAKILQVRLFFALSFLLSVLLWFCLPL